MKKVFQTNIRKVYNPNLQNNQSAQESQMHAVKKIHNLLSSGAVTVTGPNQSRITKPQPKFQSSSSGVIQVIQTSTHNSQPQQLIVQQQSQSLQPHVISSRCYVCDEPAGNNGTILNDAVTSSSSTKFPNKIGQIVGDAFVVIISVDDVLCKRCTTMVNHLDRLENDIERVKQNLLNMLYKKYSLSDDGGIGVNSPPIKMQRLNSGNVIASRKLNEEDSSVSNQTRKITVQTRDPIENQLSNIFEGNSLETTKPLHPPQQGPVQQMKIISPQIRQQQLAQVQDQQKKGPIKIYKCMSCDFKTTDLKQFQPHYETCRQQNGYTCKTCKRSFPSLPALRQHIAEKHPTEYTCNICNINFLNEITLKKHLEMNHTDLKPVNEPVVAQLFSCNLCAFTSSDKSAYEDHVKRHAKLKPFKCRLCSTRFETREQANIHAKTHQTNYYKCGSCSASFSQKEMLLKHFETHDHNEGINVSGINTNSGLQQKTQIQKVQPAHQQIKSQQQSITTQKLLQDTIDEALRESENLDSKGGIHFFSCNICSLTFIQETYYNQHMETHKQDKKVISNNMSTTNNNTGTVVSVSYTNPGISGASINKTGNNLSTSGNDVPSSGNTINNNAILEADIESIFEKLHSDKSDNESSAVGGTTPAVSIASTVSASNENFVITSQENATGSITFNVTIPKDTASTKTEEEKSQNENITVGISMPVLDQPDEESEKTNLEGDKKESTNGTGSSLQTAIENQSKKDDKSLVAVSSVPVSMPSLDDDTDMTTSITNTNSTKISDQTNVSSDSGNNTNILQGSKSIENQEGLEQSEHQHEQQQENEEGTQQQEQHIMNSDQVSMELDDIHNAESGQIKFILNENGQIIQLDNHIITTDAEGNQILVQGTDSEQIQQLLQSVGVLHSGDGLDSETLQMIQGENNQMILVQGDEGPQLIDASLLNADGHIVIQQQGDGEIGEGAHAIGEDGVRIPVSVAYTADGQQVVTAHNIGHHQGGGTEDQTEVDDRNHNTTGHTTVTTQSLTTVQTSAAPSSGTSGETFFALEELMHQPEQKSE